MFLFALCALFGSWKVFVKFNFSFIFSVFFLSISFRFFSLFRFCSEFLDSSRQAEEHLPIHTVSEVNTTVLGIMKLHPKNEKQYIMNSPPGQITVLLLIDESNINEVAASPIMQAFSDAIYGYTGYIFNSVLEVYSGIIFWLLKSH